MKTYEETARRVLGRVDEYNEKAKKRNKTLRIAAICQIIAVLLAGAVVAMAVTLRSSNDITDESGLSSVSIEKPAKLYFGGAEYVQAEEAALEAGDEIGNYIGEAPVSGGKTGVTAELYAINGVSSEFAVAAKLPDGGYLLCCNASYVPATLGELGKALGFENSNVEGFSAKFNAASAAVNTDGNESTDIGDVTGEYTITIAGRQAKVSFTSEGGAIVTFLGAWYVFAPESADTIKPTVAYVFNPSLSEPTPPFTLPEGSRWFEDNMSINGYYSFPIFVKNEDGSYTRQADTILAEYAKTLESEGFAIWKLKNEFIAYRNDCCVTVSKNYNHSAILKYYAATPGNTHDVKEAERAASVIREFYTDKNGKTSVPRFLPIDITPEGCCEATGGRLYYMPGIYDADQDYVDSTWSDLRAADPDEAGVTYAALFQNAWASHGVFFIAPDHAHALSLMSFAVADIDADGTDEFFSLHVTDALTSLPHYAVASYENDTLEQFCQLLIYHNFRFVKSDDRLLLESVIKSADGTESRVEWELCTDELGVMMLRDSEGGKIYTRSLTLRQFSWSSWVELRPGGFVHYPAGTPFGGDSGIISFAACNTTGQITDVTTALIDERFGRIEDAAYTKVTPRWIIAKYGAQIYKRTSADSVECFWATDGGIYPFGAELECFSPAYIYPCDFDEDGNLELLYYATFGKDRAGWRAGVLDLDDMTDTVVTESGFDCADNCLIRINGDYYIRRHYYSETDPEQITFALIGRFRVQKDAPGGVTYENIENPPVCIDLGTYFFTPAAVTQGMTFSTFEDIYEECAAFVNSCSTSGAYVCIYVNACAMGKVTGLPINGSYASDADKTWYNAIVIEPGKASSEDVLKLACAAVLETADKYCMYDRVYVSGSSRPIHPYIYYAEEFATYDEASSQIPFDYTVIDFSDGGLKVYEFSDCATDLAPYLAEKYPVK